MTLAPQVYVARFTVGSKARTAGWVTGFALLTGLLAQFEIVLPFTPVPITGQTLGVLLAGAALGSKAGFASMALYNVIGIAGLPVFAGGVGGLETALGATSGYLLGFMVAAYIVGRLAEGRADRRASTAVPAFIAGSLVIYLFGLIGLMLTVNMTLPAAFAAGVVPFLIGDAIKAFFAGVLTPVAWKLRGEG